jgi:sugar phosphate isomerase/epimerase
MDPGMRLGVMATLDDYDIIKELEVDFIEILLRDGDPLQKLGKLAQADSDLIVHAPERMKINGQPQLIDLACEDPRLREIFIQQIDEVAGFAKDNGMPTVVHPGGVGERVKDRDELSKNLVGSLGSIDGVLWMENMPRHYHQGDDLLICNLLTSPREFDAVLPYVDGVTLDISHAYLSVDKGGNSAIGSFFSHLKGKIKHVHLSDASYPDNEGVQLGSGEVDLRSLPRMRGLPVLLEIWGGHLHECAGYREALGRARMEDTWFKGCVP